jgi:hypothetical protein
VLKHRVFKLYGTRMNLYIISRVLLHQGMWGRGCTVHFSRVLQRLVFKLYGDVDVLVQYYPYCV